MKKIYIILLLFSCTLMVKAQRKEVAKVNRANYDQAAKYSPGKLRNVLFSTAVQPTWLEHSNRFWYSYSDSNGPKWYLVDATRASKNNLFDNADLAAKITKITRDPYDAANLKINNLKFTDDEKKIRFEVNSTIDTLKSKEEMKDSKSKTDSLKKKTFYFEYDLASTRLTELNDSTKQKPHLSWASFSPDTNAVVFIKNYNLYWMDKVNYLKAQKNEKDSTIVDHQLTTDGVKGYAYGGDGNTISGEEEKNKDKRLGARILWSPDGKYFTMTRKDSRHLDDLWVINNVAAKRPTLETYKYQMPGESDSTKVELYIFNFTNKTHKQVNVDAFKNQTISMWPAKQPVARSNNPIRVSTWHGDNDGFYFQRSSRDLKRIDLGKVSVTGEVKILVEERSNVYLDIQRPELINGGKEFVFWSERDGWGHLYLYDENGNLKNQITTGEFFVSSSLSVDEKTRTVYFAANGKEKGEDPYFNHLYSINLSGSGLKLLNKGDFDHEFSLNDDNKFFVNNWSRVNTVPESALYDNSGRKVLQLEKADLSQLFATGYKFPEPFKVKADDGITDLYGVMYKPFDFDSTKTYPIIEYVYPGPQTEAVNKAFGRSMDRTDRLAQLGFIVVTVGNRGGHPNRSNWYHTYGYGNLRDYGLADKKATAEQLADRHPFIDINKVGITGHSGGGFMSTAAMLVYPDFFKVAVSGAGNHENNIYNRWWSERHHGVSEKVNAKGDTTFSYSIDKNSDLAKNLKGHLLLVTGDIDNNVHPAGTIRMANALIKANKRFDFMLMPGQRHAFGDMTEYFFWKMGEYFAEHLLGDYRRGADIMEMNRDVQLKR